MTRRRRHCGSIHEDEVSGTCCSNLSTATWPSVLTRWALQHSHRLTLMHTAAAFAVTIHDATPLRWSPLPRPVTFAILRSQWALLSWSAPQADLNLVSYHMAFT